jgi:hypothetical protein
VGPRLDQWAIAGCDPFQHSKFIQDIPDIVSQGGAPQAPAMRAGGHALIVRRRDNGNSVHF